MCGGTVQNVTTDDTVLTVSGLTPNIAVYTFRVAAVGTNGVPVPLRDPVSITSASK